MVGNALANAALVAAPFAGAGAGAGADAGTANTATLLRAVDSAELASIESSDGQLLASPGGGIGKYFAFTPEGSAAEGKALSGITGDTYTTVKATFPNSVIKSENVFSDATRSGPVRSVVVGNENLDSATNVQKMSTNSIP